MAAVDIATVEVYSALAPGLTLQEPQAGSGFDFHAVPISGFQYESTALTAGVWYHNRLIASTPIVSGPDGHRQFSLAVSSLGLDPKFELILTLTLEDGRTVPGAMIAGTRQSLNLGGTAAARPISVTTYGRTGSSLLMLLLSLHPAVGVYRPFDKDPRLLQYWLEVFRALSSPKSFSNILAADVFQPDWWLGRGGGLVALPTEDLTAYAHLGGTSIEALARFCRERISAFYESSFPKQADEDTSYFAEKVLVDNRLSLLPELFPESKEIFLVRDFRDMVCSILSFNDKRRMSSFGRLDSDSEEEFVGLLGETFRLMAEQWRERSSRSLLVKYEDLMTHQQDCLASIFSYLEVDSSPELIGRLQKQSRELSLGAQTEHQTSPSIEASIGRWKTDLQGPLRDLCNESFAESLAAFGYT